MQKGQKKWWKAWEQKAGDKCYLVQRCERLCEVQNIQQNKTSPQGHRRTHHSWMSDLGLQWCGGSRPSCPHGLWPWQLPAALAPQLEGPRDSNARSLLPWVYPIKTNHMAPPVCLWEEEIPAGGKKKGKPLHLNYCLAILLQEGQLRWFKAAAAWSRTGRTRRQSFSSRPSFRRRILCTYKPESQRKLKLVETHRCQKVDPLKSGTWCALTAPFLQLLATVHSCFKQDGCWAVAAMAEVWPSWSCFFPGLLHQ